MFATFSNRQTLIQTSHEEITRRSRRYPHTLEELSDPKIAEHSQQFFKTGPGEYSEGDTFIGLRVPVLRSIAKQFRTIHLSNVECLLQSPIHEERLLSLFILVLQFQKGDAEIRKSFFETHCLNRAFVNNGDLVDSSAHLIVGPHLQDKSRQRIHAWAKSNSLWERRIAMLSTFAFIRQNDFADAI